MAKKNPIAVPSKIPMMDKAFPGDVKKGPKGKGSGKRKGCK